AVAVLPALALTLWNVNDPSTGAARQAGWVLWPIFGASNQMLAGLTLMVVTLYFWQLKRPILPVLIPMIFVMTATLVSIVIKTTEFFANNWLLFGLNLFLIVLFVWMIYEGFQTVTRTRVTG
ncbi:MAG TPA: carbon starvation CstA 5TM domain-containing protein, partial [Candidatus Marinimicrobia bacterium]|nr:carbon starvation CstA 5TM domain-containing protein [Candidatus Neomarinimicrobiota bacterium]